MSQSFRSKKYRNLGWLRDTFKFLELVVIHGFIVYFSFFTLWSTTSYVSCKTVGFPLIIGNTKAQRAGLTFSRQAREPHTLVGPVSLALFYLPTFRLTARAPFLTKAKSLAVLQFNTYVVIDKIEQCVKRSQWSQVQYTLTSSLY